MPDFDSTNTNACTTIMSDVTTDSFLSNNYNDVLIYRPDIDTTKYSVDNKANKNCYYISLNYGNSSSTYLTYTLSGPTTKGPSNYTASNMYIFTTLHKNININYNNIVGELVIKHKNNVGNIIYCCYFLENHTDYGRPSAIDNILDMAYTADIDNADINLNTALRTSGCYLYNDLNNADAAAHDNLVIVFKTPIIITKTNSQRILNNNLLII